MAKTLDVFTKAQVKSAMSRIKQEHEGALAAEKDRIFALVEENAALKEQNAALVRRDKLISDALVAAVEKAKEIEQAAKQKCDLELKRLRLFQMKWEQYFARVAAQYPVDDNLKKVEEFTKKVGRILGDDDFPETQPAAMQEMQGIFAGLRAETAATAAAPFDPKQKIEAEIAPIDLSYI